MKKFLLTAVLITIGSWVFAQERIAVFPFEDMENVLTRNESVMFYREFSNEFTNRSAGRFSVVPRQEVERLINTEAAFQLSDFSARAKTAEMQRVLNGTQILSGLIGKLGNNIRITVSLYTYPELQQLPGGTTVSVANKNELFSKIPELVQNMQNEIAGGGTEQSIPQGLMYEIVDGRTVTITKYIGNAATVNIPSHIEGLLVTTIGKTAFFDCDSLASVTIPSSVMSIGETAFYDCDSLTNITIPSSVTSIGERAFFRCYHLTNIIVDNRNPAYASIDGVLFDKNIRTLITYPSGKNQRTYIIPSSVMTIGLFAFYDCDNLTSVTIPSSVTSIGEGAFHSSNNLTNITIPSSVTSLGRWVFSECNNLTSVTLSRRTQVGNSVFPETTRITYRD